MAAQGHPATEGDRPVLRMQVPLGVRQAAHIPESLLSGRAELPAPSSAGPVAGALREQCQCRQLCFFLLVVHPTPKPSAKLLGAMIPLPASAQLLPAFLFWEPKAPSRDQKPPPLAVKAAPLVMPALITATIY